ncbi:hypothetical protein SprV_0100066700 [Sparganum proliferum]
MSDHSTTTHATASAGTDALRNPDPVVRANSMRAGLLNRGRTLGIGCWNVRTFLDPGAQSLTARSLDQYNADVCCLSEVQLPDSGSREIKISGVELHFTLYHSGSRDSSGRHGVAIALSQKADPALLAWEPVNDWMAYVRPKGHFTNISIVSVYAPTSAAEQRDKEAFYSQLEALVERLPRRDLLIVAGEWNGRTGPGGPTTSHLLGRFGLGPRCENVYGAAEKIPEYPQRRRSEWISGRTPQLSTQTARAKSRNNDRFRQLRKLTAKSARDGRKQYWAEMATSMEQASNFGDTRKLYQLIPQVSGRPSTLSDRVRDVNDGFIADNWTKVERWREHFEHHLNFDTQPTTSLLSSSAECLPSPTYAVPCDPPPPSEGEFVDVIRKLRNNKAPG